MTHARRWVALPAIPLLLTLAACSTTSGSEDTTTDAASAITVGTTDKVAALDPAGEFDAGSGKIASEVYAHLLASPAGSTDLKPDLAVSASFENPTTYKVVLKSGLKFANGDDLTASDVKFSFDRQQKIADPNGPSSLLYNLKSTEADGDTTVLFHLRSANDQVFPQVVASAAGTIVDEQVFSPTAITPDATILAKKPFAGPYSIASYKANELVTFSANGTYQGVYGKPVTHTVNLQYFADASNLKLELQNGDVDVAYRTLTTTDVDSLAKDDKLAVHTGAATGIRFLTFNVNTQPFGAKTPDADPAKALAVRQAVADLVDRAALAQQIYKGTFSPLYAYVPTAIAGSSDVLKPLYGNGSGGPDLAKAKQVLAAAGITTPVKLNLQYNTDHLGSSTSDEFALVKSQLEQGGLFSVKLGSTEWVQYKKDVAAGSYPAYLLAWYADYLDAQDFFQPLFGKQGYTQNGYDVPSLDALIEKQATTPDAATRVDLAKQIQDRLAKDLPTVPLLQGGQVVVANKSITGIDQGLASGGLPFALLGR
jgi:peptide/nickel transport system substrate-binding protein